MFSLIMSLCEQQISVEIIKKNRKGKDAILMVTVSILVTCDFYCYKSNKFHFKAKNVSLISELMRSLIRVTTLINAVFTYVSDDR